MSIQKSYTANDLKSIPSIFNFDLKTLREIQIIWLVANLNHHSHFNKFEAQYNPKYFLNSIYDYISHHSSNSVQKYVSFYTKWWNSAYYTSNIDIMPDILRDMNLHCPQKPSKLHKLYQLNLDLYHIIYNHIL